MHRLFIRTPKFVQWLLPHYVWRIPAKEKVVFITFDDGPHPTITPFVLDELQKYKAKATFFCVGNNVLKYPDIFRRILEEGHMVGNHTQDHVNGWKTPGEVYIKNVAEAHQNIKSHLFRPPYGKIRRSQAKKIEEKFPGTKIILWDVLSADFDQQTTPEACLQNVLRNVSRGSIVVFHDSEKAFRNLKFALPNVLNFLSRNGYNMESIRTERS